MEELQGMQQEWTVTMYGRQQVCICLCNDYVMVIPSVFIPLRGAAHLHTCDMS